MSQPIMGRPPFGKQGPKKKYSYVPPPSSGAYIILVSMLKAGQDEFIKNMSKQQVLDYCTKYSLNNLKDNSKICSSVKGEQ